MRTGTIISSIGFGAAVAFTIVSALVADEGMIMVAAAGMVTFFIGLSFVINGLLLTVPKNSFSDKSSDAQNQRQLDAQTNELILPESNQIFSSVTEHTTQHLKEKELIPRN